MTVARSPCEFKFVFEWRQARAAAGSRDTIGRVINERVGYVGAAAASSKTAGLPDRVTNASKTSRCRRGWRPPAIGRLIACRLCVWACECVRCAGAQECGPTHPLPMTACKGRFFNAQLVSSHTGRTLTSCVVGLCTD